MKYVIAFSFIAALTILFSALYGRISEANAQTQICNTHDIITDHIATKYGEVPVSMGLTGSGHMIEVFVSKTGTWTILITRPNGMSCVTSSGNSWATMPPDPEGWTL